VEKWLILEPDSYPHGFPASCNMPLLATVVHGAYISTWSPDSNSPSESPSLKPSVRSPIACVFTLVPLHKRLSILMIESSLSSSVWPASFQLSPVTLSYKKLEKISSSPPDLVPFDGLTKLAKPKPWVTSCSNTVVNPISFAPGVLKP